ncbi:hypothetical protein [Streptomyces sp. ATCC 21386]|uniref:hypothetical protein n=1 Tax=Streptomyces sp. ATCC 21386 TaxID=2699428 RepID=UPI001BFFD121|nr:hypothetical protein [Streptomyces sp. ATCC 21386]
MNVLLCATCGTRLTAPVRQLDEMPEYPGWDGLPGPDGRRHGPPSVPCGTYVVDPLPFGAPFGPVGPDEEYDGIVPGGTWKSDEVAIVAADCTSGYETRLVPGAVRVEDAE